MLAWVLTAVCGGPGEMAFVGGGGLSVLICSAVLSGALSCPSSSDTPGPWEPLGDRLEGRQSSLADQQCSLLPERVLPERGGGLDKTTASTH